jgi:hypothetical protein
LKEQQDPPRAQGCPEFEQLAPVDRQAYNSDVVLPVLLELFTIHDDNLVSDAEQKLPPEKRENEDEVLVEAHRLAVERLLEPHWVSELKAAYEIRSMARK